MHVPQTTSRAFVYQLRHSLVGVRVQEVMASSHTETLSDNVAVIGAGLLGTRIAGECDVEVYESLV